MNTKHNCAFIYRMHTFSASQTDDDQESTEENGGKQIQISALFSWFLPEKLDFKNENVISSCSSIYQDFICRYYPAKNEEYKKKRDNCELDDSLAQALIHDDLESLQKIIANYEIIII